MARHPGDTKDFSPYLPCHAYTFIWFRSTRTNHSPEKQVNDWSGHRKTIRGGSPRTIHENGELIEFRFVLFFFPSFGYVWHIFYQ